MIEHGLSYSLIYKTHNQVFALSAPILETVTYSWPSIRASFHCFPGPVITGDSSGASTKERAVSWTVPIPITSKDDETCVQPVYPDPGAYWIL